MSWLGPELLLLHRCPITVLFDVRCCDLLYEKREYMPAVYCSPLSNHQKGEAGVSTQSPHYDTKHLHFPTRTLSPIPQPLPSQCYLAAFFSSLLSPPAPPAAPPALFASAAACFLLIASASDSFFFSMSPCDTFSLVVFFDARAWARARSISRWLPPGQVT